MQPLPQGCIQHYYSLALSATWHNIKSCIRYRFGTVTFKHFLLPPSFRAKNRWIAYNLPSIIFPLRLDIVTWAKPIYCCVQGYIKSSFYRCWSNYKGTPLSSLNSKPTFELQTSRYYCLSFVSPDFDVELCLKTNQ